MKYKIIELETKIEKQEAREKSIEEFTKEISVNTFVTLVELEALFIFLLNPYSRPLVIFIFITLIIYVIWSNFNIFFRR